MDGIRSIRVENEEGMPKKVSVVFGPHYYVEITEDGGKVTFNLGATHHGFKVGASEIGKGLELVIGAVRAEIPDLSDERGMSF